MVGDEIKVGEFRNQNAENDVSENENRSIYFSVDKTRELLEAGMKDVGAVEVGDMLPELVDIVTGRYGWEKDDQRLKELSEKIEDSGTDLEKGSLAIFDFFVNQVGDKVHEEYLRRNFVESIKGKTEIVELNEILSCHKAEDGDVYIHLAPCRTMAYPDRMLKFIEGMSVLANNGFVDEAKSVGFASWMVSEVPEMHDMLGFEVSTDPVSAELALSISNNHPEKVGAAFMSVDLLRKMYGEIDTEEIVKKDELRGSFLSERELVVSDGLGVNIDHNMIPEPVYLMSLNTQRSAFLANTETAAALANMETSEILRIRMEKVVDSLARMKNLEDYLKDLKDPVIRVHPPADMSPLCVDNAFADKGSGRELNVDLNFFRSMDRIVNTTNDCTLVVPFFDKRNGEGNAANIPSEAKRKEDYINIVENVVERYGNKVRIQIGNEVNVLWGAKKQFEHPQHVSEVDPIKYADFYFETVSRVKEKFPNVRIGLAGLVCFDPEFLKRVLERLKELGLESGGIDAVDVHMYRKEVLLGAEVIRDGAFVDDEKTSEPILSYEDQLRQYQKIIKESGFDVELIVGEFRFGTLGDQEKADVDMAGVRVSKQIDERVGITESILYPLGQID